MQSKLFCVPRENRENVSIIQSREKTYEVGGVRKGFLKEVIPKA